MLALDYTNEEHVRLFNKWQNDPRVAHGWNERGSLEEHRRYLRTAHEDPHQLTLLGKFDDDYFAYFEVYWAKEDHVGVYYDAGDYDRGRHSLVGEARFRGPHRIRAWGASLVHYLFPDEPRTMTVIEEPNAANKKVLAYDTSVGFNIEKMIDFPHERSALETVSRERFFQSAPFYWSEREELPNVGERASRL